MRQVINHQLEFGQVDISKIKFDPKSRDDIPRVLRGLQYIYITPVLRESIFGLLEKEVSPKVNKGNGRPGMELWTILVLGVLRLDLNADYDRIHDLCNNHGLLRKMLGHSDVFDESYYNLQTIKDNVRLLTEDLLLKINEIIVNGGHLLCGKKSAGGVLHGRCDSFVVETNIHYPTDTNLLLDAMRKSLSLSAELCTRYDISALRQHRYNMKQLKYAERRVQKVRRGKNQPDKVITEHKDYLQLATFELAKIEQALSKVEQCTVFNITDHFIIKDIRDYIKHAKRQIDQIHRRVIVGEVIPHNEKVFSIFEPYSEWISKGKAGVLVEFGLKVCIVEDQHQFILHHRIMEQEVDSKVAVAIVNDIQKKFPNLNGMSFDKGFHSPDNQEQLSSMLNTVVLPRKGKLSKAAKEIESTEEFRCARKHHSAVESAINALEVHGLNRCLDHGIDGFRRYVALAVVTRNIHRIGDILYKREQEELQRQERKKLRAANVSNIRLIA